MAKEETKHSREDLAKLVKLKDSIMNMNDLFQKNLKAQKKIEEDVIKVDKKIAIIQDLKANKIETLRGIEKIADDVEAAKALNSLVLGEYKIECDKKIENQGSEIKKINRSLGKIEKKQKAFLKLVQNSQTAIENFIKMDLGKMHQDIRTLKECQVKMEQRLGAVEQNQIISMNRQAAFEKSTNEKLDEIIKLLNK